MEGRRSGWKPLRLISDEVADGCCCGKGGFTLVELFIVLAILALLSAIMVPSLSAAKRQASLSACAVQMRGAGVAIRQFAAVNQNRLPPFAFSDHRGNLPLSGHWGGQSQKGDPDCFCRFGLEHVNLQRLVAGGYISQEQLICPGAEVSPDGGAGGYFPYTTKFSTYCLRMPYSEDLFRCAAALRNWSGRGLLGIYTLAPGGYEVPFRMNHLTVPLVRLDMTYREIEPVGGEQRTVNLLDGAILSDAFWYRDHRKPADERPGLDTYEVRAGWCHGKRFNVLFGDGAVRAIADDGTVADNSVGPDDHPSDDGANFASYAIRVWRFFEDNR